MNSPFTQRANECVRLTSPLLAASTPNQENNPRPAPARPQPKTQMPESGNPVAALGSVHAIAAQIVAETPPIPKAIAKANTGSRTLNIVLLAILSPSG